MFVYQKLNGTNTFIINGGAALMAAAPIFFRSSGVIKGEGLSSTNF
jgi:hypothetical protein